MFRTIFFPIGLSLLAAGCATQAPDECKMVHVTDLPLLHPAPVLLTPALLNEQPTTMMLDTGAQMTLIAKPAAERLHLSLQSTDGWVQGIGGSQDLYAVTAHDFRIGDLHGHNLALDASDIGLARHADRLDGVFGADFLAAYDIDFDLPDDRLRIFKVLSGCATPAADLDQPLYLARLTASTRPNDRRPHVRVRIGGVWLTAVVDSGSQGTVIFRNAARRLGLRLADLSADHHGHALGVGPHARDAVEHIMAPIEIGEITIANLPVTIVDERADGQDEMLLGLDFFAHVHVWLSFHSQTMLMQYPPKPSPKLAGD